MTTNPTPYPFPNCTCERKWQEPNASMDTPFFEGIRRFGTWVFVSVDGDCLDHSYLSSEYGLAAALRYDLPLGTR